MVGPDRKRTSGSGRMPPSCHVSDLAAQVKQHHSDRLAGRLTPFHAPRARGCSWHSINFLYYTTAFAVCKDKIHHFPQYFFFKKPLTDLENCDRLGPNSIPRQPEPLRAAHGIGCNSLRVGHCEAWVPVEPRISQIRDGWPHSAETGSALSFRSRHMLVRLCAFCACSARNAFFLRRSGYSRVSTGADGAAPGNNIHFLSYRPVYPKVCSDPSSIRTGLWPRRQEGDRKINT